jgi:ATP-dependent Clp protease ATP-binding subunit ClpC
MNESILRQLKVIVERAVRPVRASVFRKRKMREELLAHVSGVFEEEARLGDEQTALARTQERFGQAAELTGQLQASVPRADDLNRFAEDLVGYTAGGSALRLAARAAAVIGAVCFILLGIAIFIQVLRGQGSEWLTVARVPGLLAPLLMAFWVFSGTLLAHGLRQALFGPAGRSWLRAGLVAAAAWLIVPATAFAVCLAVTADIQRSFWDVVPLLPNGVLAPVVAVAWVFLVDSECRHDREWASLQIE